MKTTLPALSLLAAAFALAPYADVHAQAVNTDQGRTIATQGTPNGATACVSCHGAQGEGNGAAGFPRLAGQSAAYLERQLKSYADGSRKNPVMAPIAQALSQQQAAAVAAYYASLTAPATPPQGTPAAARMTRGQALASIGDEHAAVQACANCHGPGGRGEPPTYPTIAGQHRGYLVAALKEWKSDARKTDPSRQMNTIASRLSDEDIEALADYYSSQPPAPVAGAPQASSR